MRAFEHVWHRLGGNDMRQLEVDLLGRYSEAHRYHHTLEHIAEGLQAIARMRALSELGRVTLLLGWLYQDAEYDTHAHDNEVRSADLLMQHARAAHLRPRHVSERSAELVCFTARHTAPDGDVLAALMSDVDLSVLGAKPSRYTRYARAMRREYA